MRQGRQYGLSAEQKADIWQRWKVGESLHEIGRAFGKDHGDRGVDPLSHLGLRTNDRDSAVGVDANERVRSERFLLRCCGGSPRGGEMEAEHERATGREAGLKKRTARSRRG